jgi:hypothetical protein
MGFAESKLRHLLNDLKSLSDTQKQFGLEFRLWSKSYRIEETLLPVADDI